MNRAVIIGLVLALCFTGCDASSSVDATTTTIDERCAKLARSVPAIFRAISERATATKEHLDDADSGVSEARDGFSAGNFSQGMNGLDGAEFAISDARSSIEAIPDLLEEAASAAEGLDC